LLGSDAGNPVAVPGFSAHQELALLVEAGLTPFEALRSATSDAGEFMTGEAGMGTITEGQVADLVLVAANPLEDIANAARIEGVMLAGRWLPGTEIGEAMTDLVSTYDTEMEFFTSLDVSSAKAGITFYDERKESDADAFVFREEGIISCVVGFSMLGNVPAALELAELGMREYPDSWLLMLRLAELQAQTGQREAALASLQKALLASPDNPIVLTQLGWMRDR
jgi:tetratricopeptide (TPR) repeat protein